MAPAREHRSVGQLPRPGTKLDTALPGWLAPVVHVFAISAVVITVSVIMGAIAFAVLIVRITSNQSISDVINGRNGFYVFSRERPDDSTATDRIGIEELRELIRSFPEQGITVILSSHILSEVQLLADKVGIISGGIPK